MSDDFWTSEVEIDDLQPGKAVERTPKDLEPHQEYRLPNKITANWAEAQLTKKEWAQIKRTQSSLKLNPAMIESMCRDAAKGLSKRSIMARHGMSVTTWYAWERKAAEEIQPYALWYNCMMYTVSTVEEELLDNIRLAGMADWKASKWLLETMNRDEYGPTPKGDVIHTGDTNVELSVNHVSNDMATAVANILKQIMPEDDYIEGEVVEDGSED